MAKELASAEKVADTDHPVREVYVIWTNKGGVGKTTLTFHLSTVFAEEHPDWKVLVCDMCPQANISMTLLTTCADDVSPPAAKRERTDVGGSTLSTHDHDELIDRATFSTRQGAAVVRELCHRRLISDMEVYHTIGGYIQSFVSRKQEAKRPAVDFVVQPCRYNKSIAANLFLICGDTALDVSCERLEQYRRMNPGVGGEEPWREGTLALRELIHKACEELDPSANWAVFIDTNPALTTYTQLALVAGDYLLVPVNADDFSQVAVKALFDVLQPTGSDESDLRFSSVRKLTFAYKARESGLALPRIRLVIHNRKSAYGLRKLPPLGDIISDTLYESFKKYPTRFVDGKKVLRLITAVDGNSQSREKKLSPYEEFCCAYTADLKDFHTTAVLCTHTGQPLSMISSQTVVKPVTKGRLRQCREEVVNLLEQIMRRPVKWWPQKTTRKQLQLTAVGCLQPGILKSSTEVTLVGEDDQFHSSQSSDLILSGTFSGGLPVPGDMVAGQVSLTEELNSQPGTLQINECDIPYLPAVTAEGQVSHCEECKLSAGQVTATFPGSCLPAGSRVALMVVNIEEGFRVRGAVDLSPLVIIGPHRNEPHALQQPITVSLPLKISKEHGVIVRVSHTSFYSPLQWEMVPADQVYIHDDHVDVTMERYSSFQAQSGPYLVTVQGDYMYFSVSTKDRPVGRSLQVCFSSRKEYTTTQLGDYSLSHSDEETQQSRIRAIPGTELSVTIKAEERSIRQHGTPFDPESKVKHILDETFKIKLRGGEGHEVNPKWKVRQVNHNKGFGTLSATCREADFIEHDENDQTCFIPKALDFQFDWNTRSEMCRPREGNADTSVGSSNNPSSGDSGPSHQEIVISAPHANIVFPSGNQASDCSQGSVILSSRAHHPDQQPDTLLPSLPAPPHHGHASDVTADGLTDKEVPPSEQQGSS